MVSTLPFVQKQGKMGLFMMKGNDMDLWMGMSLQARYCYH